MVAQRKLQPDDDAIYNDLYEKYGKPLEAEHWGEYLVVSSHGEILVGSDMLETAQRASMLFGKGNVLFKIGEISVGKWR